jgi:hypothetical protein
LLGSYSGKTPEGDLPNTFVTFRQLRGKVRTIFGDDWRRGERDLFIENLQMFGGADFVRRFDESSKASPTFLSGVEMMARDVASRAYLMHTGPFQGRPDDLPNPVAMNGPDAAYKREINRLYNRMLFRDATPAEQQNAFRFIQSVYRAQKSLAETAPKDLRFALTVRDPAQNMTTSQEVRVRVTDDPDHALYQEFVDQNETDLPAATVATENKSAQRSSGPGNGQQRGKSGPTGPGLPEKSAAATPAAPTPAAPAPSASPLPKRRSPAPSPLCRATTSKRSRSATSARTAT